MKLHIGYFRVSTLQQGVAGLGMEAQREAVARYVSSNGKLLAQYTEVESGRRHKNRPQLLAALAHCKKDRATLVIAKLDRLGRNVAFISALLESNVQFVCCDNPHATKTMLQMLAVFAEHEREQISERTKAALAAAKARGIKLGNPRYAESLARARAARGYKDAPPEVQNLISAWRDSDETLQAIADRLNGLNIRTPQDYRWYPSSVRSALLKIEKPHGITIQGKDEIAPSSISRLPDLLLPANSSVVPSSAGREATTEGDFSMSGITEAQRMIDIFTSVGARSFVVTKLDISQALLWGKTYSASELRDKLPAMVRTAAIRKPFAISETEIGMAGENLIVRPTGSAHFVQLDDLSAEQIERVRPAAFLIHSTSHGNHQAWIAVSGLPADKEVFKDFMRRVRKAVGGNDKSASHATRLAGTENYKVKYHPDFPVVSITHAVPGRVLTSDQLSQMGLLAAAQQVNVSHVFRSPPHIDRPWPSYEITLMRAPKKADGTPDRSKADYYFAMTCLTGGRGVEETIARLSEVSERAQERIQRGDKGYPRVTVENASAAVSRNFSKGRSRA